MPTPAHSPASNHLVTALFRSIDDAEKAYAAATRLGYEPTQINALMSEDTRQRYLSDSRDQTALADKAAEPKPEASTRAEVLGGPVGGTMGTIAPAIAAIGAALLVPGLGLAVAGPVAVALTAAGTAGLATGLVGAFTNWGIASDQAEKYENAVRKGAVVLGVETKSPADQATLVQQWRTAGGEMISTSK